MKSDATTVSAYLDTLPADRRESLEMVRRVILENLDQKGPGGKGGLEERMQYGVVAYCVPHSVWPHGHHTRPELPLMYMGLSSQKNDMVVYMLCLYQNEAMRAWFDKAWKATGKKSYLEVTGAGCCLRFKKVEDLSLEVIGEAMRRIPTKVYLENHVAALARMGKGPDGKAMKKGAGTGGPKTRSAAPASKKTAKKATKKKSARKRG
jgi:hypothetical protein